MDSAVVKVSSIGVLLPSFSLSNVDVNERDINDILRDIKAASAVAVDASSLNSRSASSACLLSAIEHKEKPNNRRGSLSSLLFPFRGSKSKEEEKCVPSPLPEERTRQYKKSNNARTRPASNLVENRLNLVEALQGKSSVFDRNSSEIREMIIKLQATLFRNQACNIGELKALVHRKFVSQLKAYPRMLLNFETDIRHSIPDDLKEFMANQEWFSWMTTKLIQKHWIKLTENINELHTRRCNISRSLKIDLVWNIEIQNILFPVLQYFMNRLNDLLVDGVDQLNNVTKPEGSSMMMQQQQQQQQQLAKMAKMTTCDYVLYSCLLQLQSINDRHFHDHVEEINRLYKDFSSRQSDKRVKFGFSEWLKTYERLFSVINERSVAASQILQFIKRMEDLTSICEERRQRFINRVTQAKVAALKSSCEKAMDDFPAFTKQIRSLFPAGAAGFDPTTIEEKDVESVMKTVEDFVTRKTREPPCPIFVKRR